jgi:hypothetical protein
MNQFWTWRREIEAELAEAEQQIALAEADLAAAQQESYVAASYCDGLDQALAQLDGPPVAYALGRRMGQILSAKRAAVAKERAAKGQLDQKRGVIADLADALRQIDQIAAPAEVPDPRLETRLTASEQA